MKNNNKIVSKDDRRGFKNLIATLKPMTGKERLEHLWLYYKAWLLVVFFAIMFICLAVTMIQEQRKEVLVGGMMVNISISHEGMNYMTNDFAKDLGAKNKYQVADVDYTNFGDPWDPETGENSYYASLILPSRVSDGQLEYIILDKYAMEYYIAYDVYMDLREFFTEEELAAMDEAGLVIYARQEDQDQEDAWAVAIKITDLPFVKEHIAAEGDVYFALSGSSKKPDMCRQAWERIYNWQPKKSN